ncbi:MAG: GNAT family N-acetyltransferase [Lachnospiraceae bacterium]|nr:GNAT family N-acetyltransferase [Lachnospiraceae bacterium]
MTEIEKLRREDIDAITAISDECFKKNFHITKERIISNLFETNDYAPEASFVIKNNGRVIGFIGTKISNCEAVYPDTAWISIFAVLNDEQNKGYGTQLMKKALEVLKGKGIKQVFIGMDFNNFFSGIPDPQEKKKEFFKELGFELGDHLHFDMEADVSVNAKMDTFDPTPFEGKYSVTPFVDEYQGLLDFLEAEFPGRWKYEAEVAYEEKKPKEDMLLLKEKATGKILGFCFLHGLGRIYGGLGPIGIAKETRGSHVGNFILWNGLMQLRKLGVHEVNIDWTTLEKFYGQFGFVPERYFLAALKKL